MTPILSRRDAAALQTLVRAGSVVVASTGTSPFDQILLDGRHSLRADEPAAAGGADAGPGPYEFLLMSLGSCTSMTVHMYAARKKWPLEQVVVRLRHERRYLEDCADCEKPGALLDHIDRSIEFAGTLDDAQRARLLEIADHCPVHRTLTSTIIIKTELTTFG
ncbi:MAG: OsmC family protein [Proteobacteria bacterium]|nr:OsmC family protein [Pseudomonadota bacterium]